MKALKITVYGRFQQRWFFPLAVALGVVAAVARPALAHEEHGHPTRIHEGTSDEAMDAIACGNVGGARNGEMLATGLAEAGVPGHIGFALFRPDGDQTDVLVVLGHGLAPVSASGAQATKEHADEGDTAHENQGDEEAGHAAATSGA